MKGAYPTFIKQCGKVFLAYVPDWEIYTEGNSYFDVIEMIRDAIGLKGIDKEDDKIDFPKISTYEEALEKANINYSKLLQEAIMSKLSISR